MPNTPFKFEEFKYRKTPRIVPGLNWKKKMDLIPGTIRMKRILKKVIFCPLTRGKKRILAFFVNLFKRFTHHLGYIFSLLNIFQWQTGKCHRNPWDDRPCVVLKFFVVAAGAWPCWPPAVPHAISCLCLQNPQFWKHEHRLKGSLHLPFTQAWILAPIVTPQRAVVPRPNLSPYFCSLHTLFSTDLVSPRATVRIGSKIMPLVFACWWLLLQHQ